MFISAITLKFVGNRDIFISLTWQYSILYSKSVNQIYIAMTHCKTNANGILIGKSYFYQHMA